MVIRQLVIAYFTLQLNQMYCSRNLEKQKNALYVRIPINHFLNCWFLATMYSSHAD